MADRFVSVADAVAEHVRPGDALHIVVGHCRWTAAAREVVRQWWERDPGFTLQMLSLSSLGALFFRGGLVRKVITGYSGDTFPNFTPNPVFAELVATKPTKKKPAAKGAPQPTAAAPTASAR